MIHEKQLTKFTKRNLLLLLLSQQISHWDNENVIKLFRWFDQKGYRSWELLCWIPIILDTWTRYPLGALLYSGLMLKLFIWVISSGYVYHDGCRIKIKLISRLTKYRDQGLNFTSCSLRGKVKNQWWTINIEHQEQS